MYLTNKSQITPIIVYTQLYNSLTVIKISLFNKYNSFKHQNLRFFILIVFVYKNNKILNSTLL